MCRLAFGTGDAEAAGPADRLTSRAASEGAELLCFPELGLTGFDPDRIGQPTADPQALDADVILAAQALSLGISVPGMIVATTNPGHLSSYVPADVWTNIPP